MIETINGIKPLLSKVADGKQLDRSEAETAFELIMSGDATPAQIGAFLIALRVRGETVNEIAAAAKIMRSKALTVKAPENSIDIVGTGGDGSGTLNISTGAALVVAGCGVPVAKHGNRALSSLSGAADVLGALGVNLDCDIDLIEKGIHQAGIGFMMAPRHHSATRHVAGARVELATRTIFNLLGPLSNPAGVKKLLVGVYAREWVEPIAHVLGSLGAERAWVVHGSDGLDELSTTGTSFVAALEHGTVTTFDIRPEEVGLELSSIEDLRGGDSEYNAAALNALLDGQKSAYRDIVLFTAAAALVVAGKSQNLKSAIKIAEISIDDGMARSALNALVQISNERNTVES